MVWLSQLSDQTSWKVPSGARSRQGSRISFLLPTFGAKKTLAAAQRFPLVAVGAAGQAQAVFAVIDEVGEQEAGFRGHRAGLGRSLCRQAWSPIGPRTASQRAKGLSESMAS